MKGGKRCIVLDLDECLIRTVEPDMYKYEIMFMTDPKYMSLRGRLFSVNLVDVNTPEGAGVTERHWGIKRPHLNRFLDYCFKNFDYVCIWSAGHYKYVVEIVNQIFYGIGKPHLIFTRDNIQKLPNGDYHKPLQEMLNHPVLKDKITLANTVFLDDRPENFISCPRNGIVIPKYKPSLNEVLNDDICLLQVEQFFRSLGFQITNNVRKLDMSKIFTMDLRNLPTVEMSPIIYATEVQETKPVYITPISSSVVTPFTYSMPTLIYAN